MPLELASEALAGGHHAGQAVLLAQHRLKAALHRQRGAPREKSQQPSLPEEELPQSNRDGENEVAVVYRRHDFFAEFFGKEVRAGIERPRAIGVLVELLVSNEDWFKVLNARCLEDVGPAARAAIPALEALAAQKEDRDEQEAARRALDRIRPVRE